LQLLQDVLGSLHGGRGACSASHQLEILPWLLLLCVQRNVLAAHADDCSLVVAAAVATAWQMPSAGGAFISSIHRTCFWQEGATIEEAVAIAKCRCCVALLVLCFLCRWSHSSRGSRCGRRQHCQQRHQPPKSVNILIIWSSECACSSRFGKL
jgi:hypothetical protein